MTTNFEIRDEHYRAVFDDAINSNNTTLAHELLDSCHVSFENWEDDECNWIGVGGVSAHDTIWKSTAEWIVEVTDGVEGSENALCHAEWIIELYEKDEDESREFQKEVDAAWG